MEMQQYSVTVWSQNEKNSSCDQRWSGPNLEEALIVASYEYGKEIILAGFKNKKKINIKKWERVNMDNAKKVKIRITVLKEIDSRLEAAGTLPKIMKSYGNESIKIFQRVHFDE